MAEKHENNQANIPHIGRPGGGPGMQARVNAEKPKSTVKTIRRILGYMGKNQKFFWILLVFMLGITCIDVLGPFFQQKAIDTIGYKDGNLYVNFSKMKVYVIVIILIYVISAVMNYLQGVIAAKLAQDTIQSMRDDLFTKISYLPVQYTDTHKHGDIMSRITNDVENVSNAISQSVTTMLSAIFTILGVLGMMMYYSLTLTIVAIVTIPLSIGISTLLGKFMKKYFVRQQKILGEMNGTVEEMVIGYRTVVAYGKEEQAKELFGQAAEKLKKTSVSAKVWGSIMGPIMNFVGNLQYVVLASAGGYLVLHGGGVTIGVIQAMLQYSKKFTHPINMIANQYATILTALAGAERVFAVIDSQEETDAGEKHLDYDRVKGAISLENIHFGYVEKEPVLKNLSLSIEPGQKIAIVGATGSGKTTIVNLLTRFYELDGGRITIDGVDITTIPKKELRNLIGIVLQDTVLFRDTIEMNIRYGNLDATREQVEEAAYMAKAYHFIKRLPDGYDTMLTEGGANLSQGQRQLLSIARAILSDPKILILDEATSSVDTRTELHIQKAMINLMKSRTSLIIAHRLSTIRDADKIVVLDRGSIVEMGSHEELLNRQGAYYNLYQKQIAGVET